MLSDEDLDMIDERWHIDKWLDSLIFSIMSVGVSLGAFAMDMCLGNNTPYFWIGAVLTSLMALALFVLSWVRR